VPPLDQRTVTVLLCGVAADTGNVRPVPPVDERGRFEYVPIPEKCATDEPATYGTIDCRYSRGPLAALLDGVRPGSDGDWLTDPGAIREQPVHRDPHFAALTYGEHRPGYVAPLRELTPGDIVAFYAGLPTPASSYKHRYLIGWFTVAEPPTVLEPELEHTEKRAILKAHPENAHARRFAGHGDLYYHDPSVCSPHPVVIVDGREPGGLLDRAIRLTDRRRGPNYYMAPTVAEALAPRRGSEHGTFLGGIKPAVPCDIDPDAFQSFVATNAGKHNPC
jgi:hypothetical protein